MVRWEPGTTQRLRAAALDLYLHQGFEQTTVTEIAESVGLTERTFFRHFPDKREVLFDGQGSFERTFVDGVTDAPEGASLFEIIAATLAAGAVFFPDGRRDYSRSRQSVIEANPPLQEREQLKLAGLATGLATAIRARGVGDPAAMIAGRFAVTVFETSFAQWVGEGETRSLAEIQRESLGTLREMMV